MKAHLWVASLLGGLFFVGREAPAQERRLEVAGQLAATSQRELEGTDLGFGGRFGFRVRPLVGIEGELTFYPSDLPDEGAAATSSRLEGLFGLRVGPRYDRFSIFGKARPGFVRFAGASGPFACVLIYPPPIDCVLAEGRTVLALDLGGGVELYPTERSLVRIDVSSLLLRYPGPVIDREGAVLDDESFWRGNVRLSFGAGLRF